ncbi:MAG: hypothetical protein ACREVE_04065 [Gammaproteobacteria bacterium]
MQYENKLFGVCQRLPLEVLRRIKADPRPKAIPVVVLTSSEEDRDIVDSYALGVNSYIAKPIEFESFVRAVSDLVMYWLLLNKPPRQAHTIKTLPGRSPETHRGCAARTTEISR